MSSITLTQIAEKPITVIIEQAISSFADSRQGWLALSLRRPNPNTSLRSRMTGMRREWLLRA
jgi:hypothetical protein